MVIQGGAAGITCAGQSRDKTYEDRRTLPLWPDHLRGGGRSDGAHHLPLYRLQTLTGSVFRINIPAPAEHFVLRSGTPKSYVKTAESGNKRRHAFCGDCGTPIYACAVDNPQTYALRVGTITQRSVFSPRRQIWRAFGTALGRHARRRTRDRERVTR